LADQGEHRFPTFDKERPSLKTSDWTPITDVARFRTTLTNALLAPTAMCGTTRVARLVGIPRKDKLKPWIEAIQAARRDVGMDARQ